MERVCNTAVLLLLPWSSLIICLFNKTWLFQIIPSCSSGVKQAWSPANDDTLRLSRPWSAGASFCPVHGYFADKVQETSGSTRCIRRGCEACAAKSSLQSTQTKKTSKSPPPGNRATSSESKQTLEGRIRELQAQVERCECDRMRLISALEAEERCMIDVFKEMEDGKKKLQEVRCALVCKTKKGRQMHAFQCCCFWMNFSTNDVCWLWRACVLHADVRARVRNHQRPEWKEWMAPDKLCRRKGMVNCTCFTRACIQICAYLHVHWGYKT